MHNVLKSSTDWKQVEKKFKEENKLKIKKMNSIQIGKREWQRDKEEEENVHIHTQIDREKHGQRQREWKRNNNNNKITATISHNLQNNSNSSADTSNAMLCVRVGLW